MGVHLDAVNEYVKDYDELSDSHPVIVGLKEMASQLDNEFMTTLAAQFQLTMRWLESQRHNEEKESDEEDLLSPNR